jgi:tetratricopeptide (TPR) repeat protein
MIQIRNLYLYLIFATLIFSAMAGCNKEDNTMNAEKSLAVADSLFKIDEFEKATSAYQGAAVVAEKADNKSVLAESYSQIARCYLKLDRLDDGKEWLAKAGDIATEDLPNGWSRYLGVKGRFEWREAAIKTHELNPEVESAANTFRDMYEYCLAHALHERTVDAANMLSIVGPKSEKIDWGLKGIKAAELGGLEGWLGPLWNNLGWNYDEIADYGKALEALKKAREYHYKSDKVIPRLVADWSVGVQFRKTGQLDSARAVIAKVSSKAESLYADSATAEYAEWVGHASQEMGEIELITGNNNRALEHFKKAKTMLDEAGMPNWDAPGFMELTKKIEDLE